MLRATTSRRSCLFTLTGSSTTKPAFVKAPTSYRSYASSPSPPAAGASEISRSSLTITRTSSPKAKVPNAQLTFGTTFTDHMLTVNWAATKGWEAPKIIPYSPISLDPSAVVFHYGLECFEGMKAYKDKAGKLRLFRPDMNMKRLFKSCDRLTLPPFSTAQFLECIKELVRTDKDWVPDQRGYSLYIRPTAIGTQTSLGVGPTNKSMLFVIASPVGPYYKTGFAAVSLYATKDFVRAWPGGTGDAKIGGNYAPGIKPQIQVAKQGYAQNLWLFGKEDFITEVGTMNFFMFWVNESGKRELITPPLDGTILPGVTRDSILQLAKTWGEFEVKEGTIPMPSVVKALKDKRVIEMFGAGTAAIVSPIKNIHYMGVDYAIPLDPSKPDSQAGQLTRKFADTIMGIQYGEIPHEWSVVID